MEATHSFGKNIRIINKRKLGMTQHYSFQDTAHYLRLTADLYPDIVLRMEEAVGHVLPDVGGDSYETD